jgi:SPP1 gp7 family putative phage head morphogenesis protein
VAVNDDLLDEAIKHQVELIRYSSGVVSRVTSILNKSDADLIKKIEAGSFTEIKAARLDKILKALRVINRIAYDLLGKSLTEELVAAAGYEIDYGITVLEKTIPVVFELVRPSPTVLRAVVTSRPFQGALLKEWVAGLEDGRFRRLRDAIRIGVTEGETTADIVRRIRGTKALQYKDGVLDISRRSAEAMTRTAVNHTMVNSREQLYKDNADLIKGVRWVSTLDSRTTAVCRARDGEVYPPNQGPRPPAHINCRSTTVPVTKSWKELGIKLPDAPEGTRSSMNGQVPAGTTYAEWLKKRPAAFQDEVLGVKKGLLFRKGGLTLDRFIDNSGHEYTLDELRRREAEAFKKAGL